MFDWLTGVIADGGYLGITLLMLAENLFPPIPSELIMPLAGFVAAKGELHLGLVVLAGRPRLDARGTALVLRRALGRGGAHAHLCRPARPLADPG